MSFTNEEEENEVNRVGVRLVCSSERCAESLAITRLQKKSCTLNAAGGINYIIGVTETISAVTFIYLINIDHTCHAYEKEGSRLQQFYYYD